VIVGGYAAVTYGSSLVTRDLDICMTLSAEAVETLRTVLAQWNPKHRMTPQQLSFLEFPKTGTVQNLYLRTDAGVGDFAHLKERAEDFEIDGRVYHVISLEDLIVAKETMGREKDLLAAKELRAIAAERKKREEKQ
jgi:hypothetical protein